MTYRLADGRPASTSSMYPTVTITLPQVSTVTITRLPAVSNSPTFPNPSIGSTRPSISVPSNFPVGPPQCGRCRIGKRAVLLIDVPLLIFTVDSWRKHLRSDLRSASDLLYFTIHGKPECDFYRSGRVREHYSVLQRHCVCQHFVRREWLRPYRKKLLGIHFDAERNIRGNVGCNWSGMDEHLQR